MLKKITSILFLLICCGFIFYMSSCPPVVSDSQSGFFVSLLQKIFSIEDNEPLTTIVRKIAHFSEFTLLGIASVNLFNVFKKKSYFGLAFGFLYAISDEVHQLFVAGRSCEFRDMCIDFCGILLGYLFFILIGKLFASFHKKTPRAPADASDYPED